MSNGRVAKGYIDGNGYRMIPDPRVPVAPKSDGRKKRTRYVAEHRYVMEQHLGRKLKRGEVVHHKDHDKLNNALENLEVTCQSLHAAHHNTTRVRKIREVTCCDEGEPHYALGLCYRHYQAKWQRGRRREAEGP